MLFYVVTSLCEVFMRNVHEKGLNFAIYDNSAIFQAPYITLKTKTAIKLFYK